MHAKLLALVSSLPSDAVTSLRIITSIVSKTSVCSHPSNKLQHGESQYLMSIQLLLDITFLRLVHRRCSNIGSSSNIDSSLVIPARCLFSDKQVVFCSANKLDSTQTDVEPQCTCSRQQSKAMLAFIQPSLGRRWIHGSHLLLMRLSTSHDRKP